MKNHHFSKSGFIRYIMLFDKTQTEPVDGYLLTAP